MIRISVTWKLFLIYALFWLALVLLASCGTRNMTKNVQDSEVKAKEGSTSEGKVVKENGSTNESSSKQQNAITNKNTETTTTTKFDPTTGRTIETTTTTKNKEHTDNSTKERKSLKTKYNRVDSNFKNTDYKFVTITTHVLDKNVDKDSTWVANIGGVSGILGIAFMIIAAIFLYKYLTRKK